MKHDLHYVEELFQQGTGVVGRYIAVDAIVPNPSQPRQNIGDLSELMASVREKGVLEPLLVRRYGDGYQIIAGERRWRACKELGLQVVPCIEKDVDDQEMLEIALIENLQRRDLTPFEEAEGLQSLAEKFHYTHAEIAQVIGKSRTSVTEILALNQIPGEVREVCRRADIVNKSLLLQIARQPNIAAMQVLADRISKQNLTRQQVREEKQQSEGKPRPFMFQAKGENYKLVIYFNKSEVTDEEVKAALEDSLENIK